MAPLVLLLLLASLASASHEILKPTVTSGKEAVLVIVPGAGLKGQVYRPLGEAVQKASSLRLWVGLLEGFIMDTANPLQLGGEIDSVLKDLHSQGADTSNVFLAGHSLGGVFSASYGKSHRKQLKGVLLYASYLSGGQLLADYPLPVLTIVGSLDGMTRVTRIADTFQELLGLVARDAKARYSRPVVVMDGINHAEFASGTMTQSVKEKDLQAEVSEASAHQTIGQWSDAFMVATLGQHGPALDQAHSKLDQGFNHAKQFFQPMLELKQMETNAVHVSNWTASAQALMSGLPGSLVQVVDEELSEISFVASKPDVVATAKGVTVHTYTHVSYPSNPLDISTTPSSPDQVAIKLKSRDAILKVLPASLPHTTLTPPQTCMDINKAAVELALSKASQTARQRFQTKGRHFVFHPDDVKTTGMAWVPSSLVATETETSLELTSPALFTAVDSILFPGMHYCKVLSPYRALEWIYVDSLRKHVTSHAGFLFGK